MNFNKVAVAAALAVSAFSSHAALSTAADTLITAANGSGQIVFISGASAVQKGFDALVTNLLNNVVYFNNDGVTALNGSGYVAVAGNLKTAAGTGTTAWAAGSAVIVIYRNSGGSVYGVNSVARAASIQSLAVTSATCGTLGAGTAALPYKCDSTASTTRIPDAGMSDVAPVFFTNPVNTEGEVADTALTAVERALLTSKPMYAQAFGIPVTKNVEATASFNRATVAAIMSGNISDWSSVAGASAGDIVICRRTPGSGSQAVVNMWAGNYPCSSTAAQLPLTRDDSPAWDSGTRTFTVANGVGAGTPIVIENDSSGNVRTCLDKAVTGGTYTAKDRGGNNVTVDFGTGGYKAIGVLSLDSIGSSLTTGNWQFRSLDGAGQITGDGLSTTVGPVTTGTGTFPTVAALNTGDWAMQGWTSFNIPTARTTGAKLAFINQFVAEAQNPTVLAAVKETKWTASAIPNGSNAGSQTLNVSYVKGNQCAPLNRNY